MLRDVWFKRLCIGAVVLVIAAAGVLTLVQKQRTKNEHLAAWKRADGLYRQSSYNTAESEYKDLVARLEIDLTKDDSQTQLASQMHRICSILTRLQMLLGIRDPKAAPLITELETEQQAFLASDEKTPPAAVKVVDEGGQPVALSFARKDRWDEAEKWLDRQGQRLGQALVQQDVPNADELKLAESLLALLSRSGKGTDLKVLCHTARQKLSYKDEEAELQKNANLALASLAVDDLARVKDAWAEIRRKFGTTANTDTWKAFQGELRKRLLKEVQSSTVIGGSALKPAGRIDLRSPDVLPRNEFAAFVTTRLEQTRPATGETVFVRHDDRCYALEAATADVKWICRVGYDMRWLPQRVDGTTGDSEQILVPWERAGNEALSLVDGADFTVNWTWHLPTGNSLAGPPVVLNKRLLVALQQGELWELSLETGKPRAFLKLPHAAGGPLAVTTDGRGAALIDKHLQVFILDFSEGLTCRDVVLPEPGENTLDAWAIWMWPFLLIFENDLTDRCRIIVLREGDNGFAEVQRDVISGRLWQAPVVKGQSFLIASDLGWEAVQSLQVNALPAMFSVFQQPSKGSEWPRLPQLFSHAEAPFVAALEGRVVRYAVNPLQANVSRQREVLWEHVLPQTDTMPSQPLQSTSLGLVVAGQSSREAPAIVRAMDFAKGQLQWEARVGNHVVDMLVPKDAKSILLRTATGEMFRRTDTEPERPRRLARVAINESVDYTDAHYSLAWVEPEPPELRMSSPEGSNLRTFPLTHAAVAPIAIFDDALDVKTEKGMDSAAGPWVAILDKNLRLHLKHAGSQSGSQFVQLNREMPTENWWRPLWLDGSGILLSHSQGELVLCRPEKVQQIVFPREVRKLKLKAGLASRPVWDGQLVWVGCGDDRVRAFEPGELELKHDILLPDRPSSRPAIGRVSAIGLANGHLAIFDAKGSQVAHEVTISKRPVAHVVGAPNSNHLWVFDTHGEMVELEGTGKIIRRRRLSGAVSAAPVWYREELLVPTTAGELVRIPTASVDGEAQ